MDTMRSVGIIRDARLGATRDHVRAYWQMTVSQRRVEGLLKGEGTEEELFEEGV